MTVRSKTPSGANSRPAIDDQTPTAPRDEAAVPLFVAELSVRWRDLDAFNHVNNANYLTYLEESRLQWLSHVPGWHDQNAVPVLAASSLNYRAPIAWPAAVAVELYCERLGNSSLTIAHRIVDDADRHRLYSDGNVVLVWMNPHDGKPVPLPSAIRKAAERALSD